MAAYFHQRGHVTKILDVISIIVMITASVIQGSVLALEGLPSYVVAASGLHTILAENSLMKYADGTYLLVGGRP